MGKNQWIRLVDNENEEINPSCMWGFIHAFGYHNWHSRLRKTASITDGTRNIRSNRFSKESSVVQDPDEMEKLLVKSTKKSGALNKRSLTAKIKALVAEEMRKEKSSKQKKKSGHSNKPKFQRTYSIHHLEPTEDDFSEIFSDTGSLDKKRINPIDEFDTSVDKNAIKSQHKDREDVLGMFKVNKELFLEILRDTEAGLQNLSGNQPASKRKRLTKSGSYPRPHLSQGQNFKPSKLEDKKSEVWSSAKGERLTSVTRSRSLSDYATTLFTSLGLLDGELVDVEGEKAIKLDAKEDLNGNLDEENKVGTNYESKSDDGYSEIDGFDISKRRIMHRRSSSLNESMDRYTKLFEHSFRKEVKLNSSNSLRLTSEHEVPSLPFRKLRSLSSGVPGDVQFSEWLIRTVEERSSHIRAESDRQEKSTYYPSISSDRIDPAHATEENGYRRESVERKEVVKTLETVTTLIQEKGEEGNAETEDLPETIDKVICTESIPSDMIEKSEACPEGDTSSCEEFQISEGLVLAHNDDVDTLAKADHHSKFYRKENTDLCYVRDILDHSGFSRKFFQQTWYAHGQVLNPSVAQELECSCDREQECFLDDFYFCSHHQLLFGLVNEVLVQIYDRSFTYYPKALSYSCHVRSLPENRMIEEVCNKVGTLLRLKPEQESIEAIVDRDLAMDDIGWMNLQLDSESLALELEDMIFNDLLEELSIH